MPALPVHAPPRDTIAAIATPPGRGGIGILRLSGPDALTLAAPLLSLRSPLEPSHARFCKILDPSTGDALDQAVATFYAAPRSYTGEDVLEIAAHGSPILLDFLLRELTARGARLANPGEFTERAFLNRRIDLTEAEAVRDLIDAQTLYQARIAAAQLGGALSRRIAPVKAALLALIAQLEAGIDFAEDDTPTLSTAALLALAMPIADGLAALAHSFAHGRLVHSGLTLAIVGEPNVGKSSLFNRLVERERAIVTATPGTTRDLVTERIALAGIPVELVDTAGLRDGSAAGLLDEAERIGMDRSRQALADADLVLVVLDATRSGRAGSAARANHPEPSSPAAHANGGPADSAAVATNAPRGEQSISAVTDDHDDPSLVAALPTRAEGPGALAAALHTLDPARTILVLNKCDLVGSGHRSEQEAAHDREIAFDLLPQQLHIPSSMRSCRPIPTSAITGEGLPALRQAIARHLQAPAFEDQAGLVTNLRQHQAVTAAEMALHAALSAAPAGIPHEMLLLDLHAALAHLDSLTGATTSDDVLNLIFSTFCIGK